MKTYIEDVKDLLNYIRENNIPMDTKIGTTVEMVCKREEVICGSEANSYKSAEPMLQIESNIKRYSPFAHMKNWREPTPENYLDYDNVDRHGNVLTDAEEIKRNHSSRYHTTQDDLLR